MKQLNTLKNSPKKFKHMHLDPPFSYNSNNYPLSFDSIGIACPQPPIYVHDNPNPFFNLCVEGNGILYIDGQKYNITSGVAMLVGPGASIHYHAVGDTYTTVWINFSGYLRKEIFTRMNVCFKVNDMQPFVDKFMEIVHLDIDNEWEQNSSLMLYEFCLMINKSLNQILSPNNKYIDMLGPARWYLMRNISEPYDAAKIAEVLNISQTHMCRLFHKAYNCTPSEYTERLKINYAKSMFKNDPSININEVGRMVGYENASYFISVFRKQTGLTPFQYKSSQEVECVTET